MATSAHQQDALAIAQNGGLSGHDVAEEDVDDVDEGDWVPRAFPTAGASTAPRTSSQSWSTAGFLGARPLEQNTKEKNSAMSVLEQLSRDFGKKR